VEIVLRTFTPEGIEVILSALVYAKILEEHAAVADLTVIDRTIRQPDGRRPDIRPNRERFFRRDGRLWVLAVVEFGEVPAIIVTVFSAARPLS
jgi:plasmid stabilization system protein ParE